MTGISIDGLTFSSTGGLDGDGHDLSETELGTSVAWNGLNFQLGSPDANDVIQATGQTIPLPVGSYSTVAFLAIGTNGNQAESTIHHPLHRWQRRYRDPKHQRLVVAAALCRGVGRGDDVAPQHVHRRG